MEPIPILRSFFGIIDMIDDWLSHIAEKSRLRGQEYLWVLHWQLQLLRKGYVSS